MFKKTKKCLVSLALALLVAGGSYQAASAYITGVKWNTNNTLYAFDTTVPDIWKSSIREAASTWNGWANFSFYNSSSAGNLIYRNPLGPTAELAEAIAYTNSSGYIKKAKLTFNADYAFHTTPSQDIWDIQSIALHELGHWLQLKDIKSEDYKHKAVMYYAIESGITQRSLYTDDVQGIQKLYGGVK